MIAGLVWSGCAVVRSADATEPEGALGELSLPEVLSVLI
jgi:hypothetical protein